MKKYIVFIISFVLLLTIFQVLTGWALTALYTPDLASTDSNISQEVVFGKTSPIPLLATLLTATLAYFISQKLFKTTKK